MKKVIMTLPFVLILSTCIYFAFNSNKTTKWVSFKNDYKKDILYKMGKSSTDFSVMFLGDLINSKEKEIVEKIRLFNNPNLNVFDMRMEERSFDKLPFDFDEAIRFIAPEIFVVRYGNSDLIENGRLKQRYLSAGVDVSWNDFCINEVRAVLTDFLTIVRNSKSKVIFLSYDKEVEFLNTLLMSFVDNVNVYYVQNRSVDAIYDKIAAIVSKSSPRKDRRDQWR